MTNHDVEERVKFLWKKVWTYSKAASILVRKMVYQNNKIFVDGYTNKKNVNTYIPEERLKIGESKEKETDEKVVKQKTGFLIYPSNKLKQAWDLWIVALLLYTAIFVPYRVSFEDDTPTGLFFFELFIDFSFLTDIVVTFFAVYDDGTGHYVTNKRTIAKNYLSGWFTLDLLTSIPF